MLTVINYWAVLGAAISSIIIGAIWHGPLFGKIFMREMGMNEWSSEKQEAMKKTMTRSYILQFIGSFVMFCVVAWYISTSGNAGVYSGIVNALILWIGFVVPLSLSQAIWGGKMSLFWINVGSMLLILVVGGAIIGGWRTTTSAVQPVPVTTSTSPEIVSLSPAKGPTQTVVTITGKGFDAGTNVILFGKTTGGVRPDGTPSNALDQVASPDGTHLTFTVPASGPSGIICSGDPKHCIAISAMRLTAGDYPVTVANKNGTSSPATFTITQ